MEDNIEQLREKVIKELEELESGMHVKLNYDAMILDKLLFDEKEEHTSNGRHKWKEFALPHNVLEKIDFENVDFDNFNASEFNFTNLYNIKLNPQTVYQKSFRSSILNGVTFIGPFDGTFISRANFSGSKNAIINPQKLYDSDHTISINECNLKDVTFTNKIDMDAKVWSIMLDGSNFSGSKNAIIAVKVGVSLVDTKLKDAKIDGSLEHAHIRGVDFTGARGYSIFSNSKPIKMSTNNKNLRCVKLNGVVLTGNCANAILYDTDFTGSIGGVVDLRLIDERSDYKTCNFTDVKVINIDGKEVNYTTEEKVSENLSKELNMIHDDKTNVSVLDKQEVEESRKKLIEENKKKIMDKIRELVILIDTTEKSGIDPRKLYHSIPITEDELFVFVDDHYEINKDFTDLLRFLNLSMIDFTNVKVSGLDFRNSGARIEPQRVYNKDISNCKFDNENVKFYDDLNDVNMENTEIESNIGNIKK